MTKTTPSKAATVLSIITRKLEAEKKLHKPDSFYEKSPEHPSSPSSSSEEEEATKKQHPKNNADEVSRELDMDGDEEEEERTEGETESSDDEKATKSDSTATVPEEADPITLDEVLTKAGVSKQERKTIKENLFLLVAQGPRGSVPSQHHH